MSRYFLDLGGVEHDALEIWGKTLEVIRGALKKANINLNDLAAVGVTNQRETTVVWDKNTGVPVSNAVVWQCTRTEGICRDMRERGLEELVRRKTGLMIATYFSGPKIKWLLENVPGARERAEQGDLLFGNIDTWLIWNLTGAHITDVTNASRTMLMDLRSLNWDDEILSELKIPESMLPEIRASSDRNYYGYTDVDILNGETPVCGDIGDQQSALFGQACFESGGAKNTYGTGCFLLLNTGSRIVSSKHGLLTTVAYGIDSEVTYAVEGSVAIAGAAVQWLRDQLQIIKSAPEIEDLAAAVSDNGGVYFVPAFVGLFSPYWDASARGTIVGLTRGSNRAHIARAVLESIAFQSLDVFDAMEKDSGIKLRSLKVDGGASSDNLLMQIQADLLGIECVRPVVKETTALGAAYAAGLAAGYWETIDELKEKWSVDRVFKPSMNPEKRDVLIRDWHRAVERSRGWNLTC